jgi:hypothetical protein
VLTECFEGGEKNDKNKYSRNGNNESLNKDESNEERVTERELFNERKMRKRVKE